MNEIQLNHTHTKGKKKIRLNKIVTLIASERSLIIANGKTK